MAKGTKHKEEPPDPPEFKRNRNGREHIVNCNDGYYKPSKRFRQIHHIICISSVSDATISKLLGNDDNFAFIKNCLDATDWNINDSHNCIGLPLKRAFVDKRAPQNWDGFPCHQVDHNPHYTDEVSLDLKKKVWQPSIKKGEKCEFNPVGLAAQLKARTDAWKEFLTERGKGTRDAWENRKKRPKTWYIPFSMAQEPTKREPPPALEDFSRNMQGFLERMFKAIK